MTAALARTPAPPQPVTDDPPDMPRLGVLEGKLNLNPALAPKVPAGAPRPFAPGEWVDNKGGGWSSEITTTIQAGEHPELNGGKPTVIPSLWLVNGKPTRVDEDTAAAYAVQSGLKFRSFATNDEAEAHSQQREDTWQGVQPKDAGKIPALWDTAPPAPAAVAPSPAVLPTPPAARPIIPQPPPILGKLP